MTSVEVAQGTAAANPQSTPRAAWIALAVLFIIQALNIADRQILSILAPHVKRDLNLSDAQLGLLIGPAIGFLYAIMGIPLGHLADKVNRIRLLSACLVVWSVFTGLGGFAANAWQLALSRIGVSAAEGGGQPISQSLLPDLFPMHRRAIATAIFGCCSSVGVFLAFSIGGAIGESHGWRAALFIAAIPGFILAAIALAVVRHPKRGHLDDASLVKVPEMSVWRKTRFFLGIQVFREAIIAVALINIAVSIMTAWGPTYLVRTFGSNTSAVGLGYGSGLSILSITCMLLAGWMMTVIGHARFTTSLRIVAGLQLTGMAFAALGLLSPNLTLAVLVLSLTYGVVHFYLPVQGLIIQNYVPSSMRGTAAAVGALIVVLVSHSTAPPLVGKLSDVLKPTYGDASLGIAMSVVVPAIALSALLFFRVAKGIDKEKAAAA